MGSTQMDNNAPPSVLVVDDEQPVRELLKSVCSDRYACAAAPSAEDALAALEEKPFDVVLTDVSMPGASGLSLCRMIGERWPRTAVVVVSGASDKDEAMKSGAVEFIAKPFDLLHLLEVVERAAIH